MCLKLPLLKPPVSLKLDAPVSIHPVNQFFAAFVCFTLKGRGIDVVFINKFFLLYADAKYRNFNIDFNIYKFVIIITKYKR
jgi:hypothetical protein